MQESTGRRKRSTRLWGALIVSASAVVPAYADPVVSWAPSAMAVTLEPNTATSVTYRLTATEEIVSAQMRVTPSLVKYLKVTPTNVSNLQSGQWVDVTVILALPIDSAPDPISGTLQLRMVDGSGKLARALSKPLPVTINVQCPCLPPDPGPAGKLTIEGVDSDADGVRDDLQRWISVLYADSQRKREAMFQYARSAQRQLLAQDENEARAIATSSLRAVDCLDFVGGDSLSGGYKEVLPILTNTDARFRAWAAFQDHVSGMGWAVPLATSIADCDFDPSALQN